ncbi:hypothetical protein [Undibacterium sp. Ji22W]|uniref:hypothetical protein n=1 Tax=Undibacterium sp. Ji22W TaxID=3413038 RepID=UPI003BF204EA
MKAINGLVLLAIAGCLAAFVWVSAREKMWDLEHAPLGSESAQASPGLYVAQVRSLSEGDSAAPYGQGVFLRHRQMPRWSTSTLVFAGYCKPEMKVAWVSAHKLAVKCTIAEGNPKLLPAPANIVVTVNAGGS